MKLEKFLRIIPYYEFVEIVREKDNVSLNEPCEKSKLSLSLLEEYGWWKVTDFHPAWKRDEEATAFNIYIKEVNRMLRSELEYEHVGKDVDEVYET